jgi:pimeloyl-ACP methyl ester carboxylesterase
MEGLMPETGAQFERIEHWTNKGDDVRLALYQKDGSKGGDKGTILFVHGSSMAATPTFDLQVPGRPFSSAMDYFASLGYDTWCVDMEGYGRSTKDDKNFCDISNGADDLEAASRYIIEKTACTKMNVYGISSGALRAALFAQRNPDRVNRLALDAHVWTGKGSPTLEERRKKLPEFSKMVRRPVDHAFINSVFTRDHPGCADQNVIDAFADAVCELDDSMPNGTYIDMTSKLPIVDPEKIVNPTIIMRGQWDGIAGMEDLLEFFQLLPNPDKQFTVMAGISHASFQQKNYMLVYHILSSFYAQPEPLYRG